jgi:hypothetical protein
MQVVVTSVKPVPGLQLWGDLARTPDGRIYLAKGLFDPVKKIDRDGRLTTLPWACKGFARDSSGRVFCNNYSGVAEILPDDQVVLRAGIEFRPQPLSSPPGPNVNGVGRDARFSEIAHIASGPGGSVLIDQGNLPGTVVRKLEANGRVTTILPPIRLAWSSNNWGWHNFAADSRGNLFFGGQGSIIRVDSSGAVSTFIGREIGPETTKADWPAQFGTVYVLRIDSRDNLYAFIGDAIKKIAPDGTVTTALQSGCPAKGWEAAAELGCTAGLVDGPLANQVIQMTNFDVDDDGNIYYLDQGANAIRKATPDGQLSTIIRGEFPKHL